MNEDKNAKYPGQGGMGEAYSNLHKQQKDADYAEDTRALDALYHREGGIIRELNLVQLEIARLLRKRHGPAS